MSINKVFISGNIVQEPELRSTKSGTALLSFTVAVNDRRKNSQTGEWDEHATYVDCKMFGSRAEKIADYLHKGTRATVEGHLDKNKWTGQDGQTRSKMEVVVDDIDFSNRKGSDDSRRSGTAAYNYTGPVEKEYSQADIMIDDIPF